MGYVAIPGNSAIATAATDQVSLTISGLAGDQDGDYEIAGYIKSPADAGHTAIYTIQPNGVTANQSALGVVTFAASLSQAAYTDLRISSTADAGGNNVFFTATLKSRTGRGAGRQYICNTRNNSATILNIDIDGSWLDTTTAITSITLASNYNSGAAGLLATSYFTVTKLRRG